MKIFKLRSSTFNHLKALLHVLEYFIGKIQHNLCLPIIAHYGYRNIVETTHEYLQFASVKYPYTPSTGNRKYAGSFRLKPALYCKILSRNNTNNCRDCAYLLMYINEASPRTGNMLVVFILNQPCRILSGNPTKNCRDCAYLLININEASPRTGNMLVVFILNQPCRILSGNPTKNCRDCAYLLININEASLWTGNMLKYAHSVFSQYLKQIKYQMLVVVHPQSDENVRLQWCL